jgi:hypothetical protein
MTPRIMSKIMIRSMRIRCSLWLGLEADAWRGVPVAFVQGVVRPSHKYLAPFQERGGEKPRDRADDDFLEKSGVHSRLRKQLRCRGAVREHAKL